MKNNNKNRKLNFIRQKNNLRLGVTIFRQAFKIADSTENESIEPYLFKAKVSLYSKYRLRLRNNNIRIGHENLDFILNTRTLLITLHNKK